MQVGGACIARALTALDVFESVDQAIRTLDAFADCILSKRRDEHGADYNARKVCIKGKEWCSEAVTEAVRPTAYSCQFSLSFTIRLTIFTISITIFTPASPTPASQTIVLRLRPPRHPHTCVSRIPFR